MRQPIVGDLTHTVETHTCHICGSTFENSYSEVGGNELTIRSTADGWTCENCYWEQYVEDLDNWDIPGEPEFGRCTEEPLHTYGYIYT